MRRFTDFFVFAAMLIIDFVVVFLLYSPDRSLTTPESFDIGYALMNLGFIALPGLVLAMCVAMVRAIWNIAPRQFYLVLLIASAATSALIWVISLAFGKQATPAELSLPVFQFAAVAVAMFIGLIMGLTKAVPTPAKAAVGTIEKDGSVTLSKAAQKKADRAAAEAEKEREAQEARLREERDAERVRAEAAHDNEPASATEQPTVADPAISGPGHDPMAPSVEGEPIEPTEPGMTGPGTAASSNPRRVIGDVDSDA